MLATTELRQRHRTHSSGLVVTARRLAEFLQSVEAEELLLIQRLRDREQRAIGSEIATRADNGSPVVVQQELTRPLEHTPAPENEDSDGKVYGEF